MGYRALLPYSRTPTTETSSSPSFFFSSIVSYPFHIHQLKKQRQFQSLKRIPPLFVAFRLLLVHLFFFLFCTIGLGNGNTNVNDNKIRNIIIRGGNGRTKTRYVSGFNGYISRPMTRQDFREVSELLYDSFDEDIENKKELETNSKQMNKNANTSKIKSNNNNPSFFPFRFLSSSSAPLFKKMTRQLGILRLEQDYSLRAAAATTRRRKYAQVVYRAAKDGSIVGVAEVGIAGLPFPSSSSFSSLSSAKSNSNEIEKEENQMRRVPTLGNLAVKKDLRRQGIATELLNKCEEIVSRSWNDKELFVAVEKNSPARALYESKCEYHLFNGEELVDIPIRQGFFGEENRQHILYYKNLSSSSFDENRVRDVTVSGTNTTNSTKTNTPPPNIS